MAKSRCVRHRFATCGGQNSGDGSPGAGAGVQAVKEVGLGREALPTEVRALVARYFETGSDVDVLLLLHYDRTRWSALAVADRLHLHRDQAQSILDRLATAGLLHRDSGGYRYGPVHPATSSAVDTMARLHPTYRVAIGQLIFEPETRGRRGGSE